MYKKNNNEDIQEKIRENFPEIASALWKAYKYGEIDKNSLNKFLEDEDIKSAVGSGVTWASIIGGIGFFSKHPKIFKILKSLSIASGAIIGTWYLSQTEKEIKEKEIKNGNIDSVWLDEHEKEKTKEIERKKCKNCGSRSEEKPPAQENCWDSKGWGKDIWCRKNEKWVSSEDTCYNFREDYDSYYKKCGYCNFAHLERTGFIISESDKKHEANEVWCEKKNSWTKKDTYCWDFE